MIRLKNLTRPGRHGPVAWVAALTLLSPPLPAAEPAPLPSATEAVSQPKPYARRARPDTNTIALHIAMRRFESRTGTGVPVWLVAVSHIGETNYYQKIQAFLQGQSLVLFEGIGGLKARQAAAGSQDRREGQEEESELLEPESLQSTLAASLDLAFQLEAIDYTPRHFQNSDLSLDQLQALLLRNVAESSEEESAGTANPAFGALIQAMDGSSWLGTVLHMGVKLLGSSPKLQAMTRLMLIDMLGQLEGDLTQIQGLPPDMKELIRVLIRERNKVVMRDLRSALAKPASLRSIAVLYGAGHMDDLEKRLVSELDYRPVEDTWLPAITVQPARAGLTASETAMIRNLIQWQMDSLKQEWTHAPAAP